MYQLRIVSIVVLAAMLSGCQTVPHFDRLSGAEPVAPRVSDIMEEVQCEILTALKDSAAAKDAKPENQPLGSLLGGEYVASVNLTLDVTNDEGVNPSLSYIEPLVTAGANFTASLSAQGSEEQHRNISVTFTTMFDSNTPLDALGKCREKTSRGGLRGDLGIREILATGLPYTTNQQVGPKPPYIMPILGVTRVAPVDPLTGSGALPPSFGTTVDFTLVYGVGGGPTWTLSRFTGPDTAGAGLLSAKRTKKDTLILAFARVTPATPPSGGSAEDIASQKDRNRATARVEAVGQTQGQIDRMILLRIGQH